MHRQIRHSLVARALVLSALLLRVAIPTGYMPASVALDGWYLQWCPSGLSTQTMASMIDLAAAGNGHHRHHHHHGPPEPLISEGVPAQAEVAQCDFGILGGDVHTAPSGDHGLAPSPTASPTARPAASVTTVGPRAAYHSRAPPRPRRLNS